MDIEGLPNFFILGAAKAGTTSLYEYLRHHPDVYLSDVKEPHYFCNDDRYEKGLNYYLDVFFPGSDKCIARGEATPHYLYYEKAARRMSEVLPEAHQRFIIILRDPVERAYSLYWNMVGERHESLSFENALEAEAERLHDEEVYYHGEVRFQYFESGLYAKQIKTYYKYFDPSKFLILFFEDLLNNPEEMVRSVYRFIGVSDNVEIVNPKNSNPAGLPKSTMLHTFLRRPNRLKKELGKFLPFPLKSKIVGYLMRLNKKNIHYPPMRLETREALRLRYKDDIVELQQIVGRKLPDW